METLLPSLLDLGTVLGAGQDRFQQSETGKRIYVEVETPCANARSLTIDRVRAVTDSWGDALSLDITSEYGIREFHVRNSQIDAEAFVKFSEDLQAATRGETITVTISIDKVALTNARIHPRQDAPVTLFVFSSSISRALDGELQDLDRLFFSDGPQCCCLLLEAPEFSLCGPYFSIWGSAVFRAQYERFRPARAKRLADARDTRREQVSWLDFDTMLTPYQFSVTGYSDRGDLLIAKVLALHCLLTTIYLADSVRRTSGVFIATFSGYERTEVAISRTAVAATDGDYSLYKVFAWAYSGKTADKLPILRSVIAGDLGANRDNNYPALLADAQRIFNSSRHNYSAFVGGFVTKYFDKVREIDEYVRTTGLEIADRVSDLVKSLTANLLATVGVAVGGFVAYALDKKSSPTFLAIGLQVYGVYILGFPLLYSLVLHGLVDYRITMAEFRRRTAELESKLHIAGLTRKTGMELRSRSAHFWFVTVSSAIVYAAIGVGCFYLAYTLPSWLPMMP